MFVTECSQNLISCLQTEFMFFFILPLFLNAQTLVIENDDGFLQEYKYVTESILINEPVQEIPNKSFFNWELLKSVSIGSSVVSIGEYAFCFCSNLQNVIIGSNVATIGNFAFFGCGLNEIVIPSSIYSIGTAAFANCTNLSLISAPNNPIYSIEDNVLYNHNKSVLICWPSGININSQELLSSIISISSYAFYANSNIKSIIVGNNFEVVGDYAFAYCNNLGYFLYTQDSKSSLREIGKFSFFGSGLIEMTIPGNVKVIGNGAFANCPKLKRFSTSDLNSNFKSGELNGLYDNNVSILIQSGSLIDENDNVTITSGISTIGSYSFYGNSEMKFINLSDSVITIEDYSFAYCNYQRRNKYFSITFGKNLKTIGNFAFFGSYLQEVTIPTKVETIGKAAFANCPYLVLINVETDNSNFNSNDGILYDKSYSKLICFPINKTDLNVQDSTQIIDDYAFYSSKLNTINFPNSVTTINSFAFSYSSLTSIKIGENIETINEFAFAYCNQNFEVILTENLKEINQFAFYNCSITEIIIPSKVKSIGICSFSNCFNLEIVILGNNITEIGDYSFFNCPKLKCLCFAGENEPKIGKEAFSIVDVNEVLVNGIYSSQKFGMFNVTYNSYECHTKDLPFTLPFSQSNTYSNSNTFGFSNTFGDSNTFSYLTQSHSNDPLSQGELAAIICCAVVALIIIVVIVIILIKKKKKEQIENNINVDDLDDENKQEKADKESARARDENDLL